GAGGRVAGQPVPATDVAVGFGITAGLLETADTLMVCPASLAGPAVTPVRTTVCSGASSSIGTFAGASSVGASFTGLTVTVKVASAKAPAMSVARTVIVLLPNASPPAA